MSPESAPEPIPTPDGKEEAPDGNQGNRNSKERARRRSEKLEDSAPTGRPAPLAATAKEYDDKSGAPTPEPVKAIEVKQQPEYKELLERFEQSQATLHAVIEERDRLQTQFANERAESAKYKKDNALLRSEIVEMTRAREPLREESFFIGQFNEMSADIESWAARETRRAPLEKIPKPDMAKLAAEFPKYGPHGIETAKWFSKQNSKFVQDRRNRIALIRHSLAIVLLDRILDLFIFGFPRDLSNNFAGVEKWICNYTPSTILQIRQAIATAACETIQPDIDAPRESTVQSAIMFLRILVPKTPESDLDIFARKLIDTSISLKDAMVKEQAIYRCYFFDNGVPFDSEWMKVAPGAAEKGKVRLSAFPGLRRFNMIDGRREFVPVVKAWTDLE